MNLINKIIAFDLDGTLARNNGSPSNYTYETITNLVKQGYHICIVTGRQWISAHQIYENCNLNSACVLCNGAFVYDPTKDLTIRKVTMSKEEVFSYVDNLRLKELIKDLMCEIDMNTYSLYGFPWNPKEIIGDFHQTLKDNPSSLNIIAKSFENQEEIKKIICQNPNYNYRYWNLQGEVYSTKFSKKEGVEELLKYYNKTAEDLVFFGDAENDLETLKFAKYGIAMKNASNDIKKVSKYVTDFDNENDGAIKFLLKLIKGN